MKERAREREREGEGEVEVEVEKKRMELSKVGRRCYKRYEYNTVFVLFTSLIFLSQEHFRHNFFLCPKNPK